MCGGEGRRVITDLPTADPPSRAGTAGGSSVGLSDGSDSCQPCDRGSGGVQGYRLVAKLNTCLRIRGKGGTQGLSEPRLELTNCLKTRTELRVDRGPGNHSRLGDLMASPGQPDVDID